MIDFFESPFGRFLRWLFFIPIAFIAYILCVFIISLLSIFFLAPMHYEETLYSFFLRIIFVNGFGGAAFVFIGSVIVPDYKKFFSIILAVIFVLICSLLLFGSLGMGIMFLHGQLEGWKQIVALCATIIGSGWACWAIINEEF